MMETEVNNIVAQEQFQEMYYVVKNIEEQYSIWPSYKQLPSGWEAIGEPKIKAECLTYIDQTWTDMRPLSLRNQMEKQNSANNI